MHFAHALVVVTCAKRIRYAFCVCNVRIHQVNGLGRRHFAPIYYAQAYSHVL